jgi:hypothetical protein
MARKSNLVYSVVRLGKASSSGPARPPPADKEKIKKTHLVAAVLIQEKIFNAKSYTTGWEITVGPGLDPLIIVYGAAVLEHLMVII